MYTTKACPDRHPAPILAHRDGLTIVVDVVVAGVTDAVAVGVLLVDVGHGGAVVARVALLVGAFLVRVGLVRVVDEGAVVLQQTGRTLFVLAAGLMA